MEDKIKDFLKYIKNIKNYSDYTITNYEEDLLFYKEYIKKENLDYLKIEYLDIRHLFNYLDENNYSKNTISRKISSIRSFYKYLARNNYIKYNPFTLVSTVKKDQKIPKFLYYNELEKLFDSVDINTEFGIRNRLLLELLYATGMRVGELENIKLKDINFNEQTIKVLGKGNKERLTYYGDYAKEYLELYLEKSREKLLKNSKEEYLFINNKGKRLTSRGIRYIINDVIEKSSLDLKISPHTLRHTFATHLLNEGCDILSVKELLGHESLKATQIYTHVTNESLRTTYLKAHPRNNKKIKE